MKKLFILACAVFGITSVQAQSENAWNEWNGKNILEHLGVGVGVGTTGISIELGTDVTDYLTIRGGMDIFPKIKMDFDISTGFEYKLDESIVPAGATIPDLKKVTIQGKTNLGDGHLLLDIHPFKGSSFRLTTGFYFASDKVVTVENKDDSQLLAVANWNNTYGGKGVGGKTLPRIGVELGDYFLAPDNNGHVDASIKVSAVRPYLGIGFGRMVPKTSRVTCNFDLGVQFWGTPEVYLNGIDGEKKLESSDLDGKDGGVLKIMSKVTVYPTMTLRLVGRIF